MARNKFDEQLETLNEQLTEMGRLVNERLHDSIQAFLNRDMDTADFIRKNDDDVNELEESIEEIAMRLILRQQPVAKDLRLISSALKMITDLERIGDQAANIAEITLNLSEKCEQKPLPELVQMASVASEMVNESIKSFTQYDLSYVDKIKKSDDIVDQCFYDVKKKLIQEIKEDKAGPEITLDYLLIAKYLERIGDHAENIAEAVIYTITGELFREENK